MNTPSTFPKWRTCGVQGEEVRDEDGVLICKARREHAQLIAAVPRMLAALGRIADPRNTHFSNDARVVAREAIVQLTGQTS